MAMVYSAEKQKMHERMVESGGGVTWDCIAQRAERRDRPTPRLTFGAILNTVNTPAADTRPADEK